MISTLSLNIGKSSGSTYFVLKRFGLEIEGKTGRYRMMTFANCSIRQLFYKCSSLASSSHPLLQSIVIHSLILTISFIIYSVDISGCFLFSVYLSTLCLCIFCLPSELTLIVQEVLSLAGFLGCLFALHS